MKTLNNIINGIGYETSSHCERVSQYVSEFLEHHPYHYTERQKKWIVRGAYLHDIGKSMLDEKLLYKSSGITEDELQMLHRHSAYGYAILAQHASSFSDIEEYEICRNIALKHHRRLDGTGYPILCDTSLELYVQIVSLFDVFDALTSKRSYHTQISPSDALQIIFEGKSGAFSDVLQKDLKLFVQRKFSIPIFDKEEQ